MDLVRACRGTGRDPRNMHRQPRRRRAVAAVSVPWLVRACSSNPATLSSASLGTRDADLQSGIVARGVCETPRTSRRGQGERGQPLPPVPVYLRGALFNALSDSIGVKTRCTVCRASTQTLQRCDAATSILAADRRQDATRPIPNYCVVGPANLGFEGQRRFTTSDGGSGKSRPVFGLPKSDSCYRMFDLAPELVQARRTWGAISGP